MSDLNKQTSEVLRSMVLVSAKKLREGCGDCGGTGQDYCIPENTQHSTDFFDNEYLTDCPTCTPRYNELMAMVHKLCWHTNKIIHDKPEPLITIYECRDCGIIEDIEKMGVYAPEIKRPRFTVSKADGYISIVEVMKLAGTWEGGVGTFEAELYNKCMSCAFVLMQCEKNSGLIEKQHIRDTRHIIAHEISTEILTTTELLQQAIISWEGVQ